MKRAIRALFENPHLLTKEELSKSEILKTLLKEQTHLAIKNAMETNKTYASLFEINNTNCYIELHKRHWIQALETCLVWYVDDENYEMCTNIKTLIQDIQKKNKPKVTIKK